MRADKFVKLPGRNRSAAVDPEADVVFRQHFVGEHLRAFGCQVWSRRVKVLLAENPGRPDQAGVVGIEKVIPAGLDYRDPQVVLAAIDRGINTLTHQSSSRVHRKRQYPTGASIPLALSSARFTAG